MRRLRNHRTFSFDNFFAIDEREIMTEQGLCYSINGPITALLQSKYINQVLVFDFGSLHSRPKIFEYFFLENFEGVGVWSFNRKEKMKFISFQCPRKNNFF